MGTSLCYFSTFSHREISFMADFPFAFPGRRWKLRLNDNLLLESDSFLSKLAPTEKGGEGGGRQTVVELLPLKVYLII